MKLRMLVDLGRGDIMLESGAQQPPIFGPCIVTKRLDGSKCHLIRRYNLGSPPAERSTALPLFVYCGETVARLS